MNSADDSRTVNNVMRHEYRELSPDEKAQMQSLKDIGLEMWELLDRIGTSRELSLAKTNLEQVVMWGVKHVTG